MIMYLNITFNVDVLSFVLNYDILVFTTRKHNLVSAHEFPLILQEKKLFGTLCTIFIAITNVEFK